MDQVHKVLDTYTEMHGKMTSFPRTEQELIDLKNFIKDYRNQIVQQTMQIKLIAEYRAVLDE